MAVSVDKDLHNVKPVPRPDVDAVAPDAKFLATLGRRVRDIRERRGMARKLLARDADVSERYLAQLESGDGNISIVLLRRIALALDIPLPELFGNGADSIGHKTIRGFLERLPPQRMEEVVLRLTREFDSAESLRRQRFALVGLRGAGKSTLGALLAQELELPFVELNREIEREVGVSLSEVFMLYGQSGYRSLERRGLEKIVHAYERVIISVGGGVVTEPETYDLLLSNFFTVWLKAEPEEHMARVAAQGDLRPMQGNAQAMQDLRRILAVREPFYAKTDAVVDTAGETVQASLVKLRSAVLARAQSG